MGEIGIIWRAFNNSYCLQYNQPQPITSFWYYQHVSSRGYIFKMQEEVITAFAQLYALL